MDISTKVKLLGPILVLVTSTLVGTIASWGYGRVLRNQHAETLSARIGETAGRLQLALDRITDDAQLLATLRVVRALVDAPTDASGAPSQLVEPVLDEFEGVLATHDVYTQVRLLGIEDDGREIVRVDRIDGKLVRVADDQLQQKSGRSYFEAAIRLPAGRVYVSEITLNRERGEIEVPHTPMLRVAAPLFTDEGGRFGFVVINVHFDRLLETVVPELDDRDRLFLCNDRGDFLLHPDEARRFGSELGQRHTILDEFAALERLPEIGHPATFEVGEHVVAGGGKMQAARIAAFGTKSERSLILGLAMPYAAIDGATAAIASTAAAVSGALMLLAAILAYSFSSRLVRPLQRLTADAGAVQVAANAVFAVSGRTDEIGRLEAALHRMLTRLRDNEAQLREANEDLKYFTRIASHDLREPARRVAALSSMLEEEGDGVSAEGRRILERIGTQCLQMVDQLSELRSFARLSNVDIERKPVDLAELVARLLRDSAADIERRRVHVSTDPLPTVNVYPRLAELLYRNLIDNALLHAKQDGFELHLSHQLVDGRDVLGVRNTAAHVTRDPEQLFQPAHAGGQDTGRVGLGLSNCRRIAERHAGRIWAETHDEALHVRFTLRRDA